MYVAAREAIVRNILDDASTIFNDVFKLQGVSTSLFNYKSNHTLEMSRQQQRSMIMDPDGTCFECFHFYSYHVLSVFLFIQTSMDRGTDESHSEM